MDPNTALKDIRALCNEMEPYDVDRLVELIQGLDQWITKGGFLPDDCEARRMKTAKDARHVNRLATYPGRAGAFAVRLGNMDLGLVDPFR